MRSRAGLFLVFAATATPLAAQSSQFGVRGLGLPMRPLSVRSTGTGGAFGLFDSESSFNPASIGLVGFTTASFQTVQSWRRSVSPAGVATAQDNRYPGIFVGAPIGGTRLAISLSFSGYTDRNFSIASRDTLILRGIPVETTDTLRSLGGVSDVRAGIAWRSSSNLQLGLGIHMLTGSNRINSTRRFSDTTYAGAAEQFTVSYLGMGVSAGVVARLGRALTLAGMVRADDKLRVERDSTRLGTTKLPVTVSGGARVQFGDQFQLAGSATYRSWSSADQDIVDQGGIGSVSTTEVNVGLEYLRDPRRPNNLPLRLGFYRSRLPFPVIRGQNINETGISIGTSKRFVGDRAGFDLAVAEVWRKGGAGFTERATLLTVGISVRP
jgi:opacity protein-like surface antigen